jgi:hypothetical protein
MLAVVVADTTLLVVELVAVMEVVEVVELALEPTA